MKKVSFIMLMLLSAVCLSACNSATNIKGEFVNNEYILSLEEVKDFYDELNVKGVEKNKIDLVCSNTKILSTENGEEFKAESSGSAYIFAKHKNKTVAKTKVSVKYKLSSPQNLNLSSEGVLTWDKSFAIISGERIEAVNYKVEIAQIPETDEDLEYQIQNVTDCQITLSEKASYSIKITAISDKENVDNSNVYTQTIHYGVMGVLDNVSFEVNPDFGSQEATVSWSAKENAKFDVYVEGFKLESDLEENKYTFDYSIYEGGEEISIEIIAKDANGLISPSSTNLKVTVLESPTLTYTFDKEGQVSWVNDKKVSSYVLRLLDYQGNYTYKTIEDRSRLVEKLNGLEENLYEIDVMAIGGDNDGYYVSSKLSNSIRVAKIAKPEASIEFVGDKANLTFVADDYVTDYKISYNFQTIYYSTTNGLTTTLDISGMLLGKHQIDIVALPKSDASSSTGVARYAYRSDGSEYVVSSDSVNVEFYVLGEMGNIIHQLDGKTSTVSFPSVTNANFYKLFINDKEIQATMNEANGKVTCQFDNLNQIEPSMGGYDIKVVAGYIDLYSNKEIAYRVEKTKRIKILEAPVAVANQKNGTFEWRDLSDDCLYSYELYQTESDYSIKTGQTPILSESNINECKIAQTLPEGYYKIKVKAISKDIDVYLDSDFYNSNNILEENFKVTKDILQPSAVFFEEDGKYKLTVTTVENASLYEIYVNGTLDGQIYSDGPAEEEYVFSADFTDEGVHEVKIKALAGNKYDENIYLDSEEFVLAVKRHSVADYLVNVVYTDFDEANHQWLTIKEVENTTKVEFLLNGEKIEGENYRLDLANSNVYGTEFKIGLILKASERVGNNYFLDSHLKEIEFARASYPTTIKYTNGNLTWTQTQAEATQNKVSLIVDTISGSDYYKRFDVPANAQTFDLLSKIENLRKTDTAFDTAYRQLKKLQVQMLTYMNEESSKYYLPSLYGTAVNGTNTVDINLLESPVLSFNVDTKMLSWEYDVDGSVFDIYVDDKLAVEGYGVAKSISLEDVCDDYTTQKKITIRARHENNLDSEVSQPIYIKELITPTSLSIVKEGSEYRASLLINTDSAFVAGVQVNGSTENVTFIAGGNIASFLLSDFEGVNDFAINLVAKNEWTNNYYLSSKPVYYTISSLQNETFETVLNNESIDWNEVGADFAGNDVNPIRYVLTFTNNGKTFAKTYENQYSVALSELETLAGQELTGEIKVTVKAIISEDYVLSVSETAKGYYGEVLGEELTTHKLDSFENVTVEIKDGTGTTAMEKKINSTLNLIFPDVWTTFSGVKFSLKIASAQSPIQVVLPDSGLTHFLYTFNKVGENYQFTLSSTVLKMLANGTIAVTLQASCEKEISSNVSSLNLSKYATTKSGKVSDDGILTVDDNQNASYLVEIAIEDTTLEASILKSEGKTTLDLMTSELIQNRFGAYTIKLLTFDEDNQILPATRELEITGYKVQGIESVYITDDGNIIFEVYMDDLTNVIFKAKVNGTTKEFTPTLAEGTTNQFYISMIELLRVFAGDFALVEGEYNFQFAVRSKGSVDSPWTDLTFNYAIDETPLLTRGRDLDKDYIIFQKSTKSDTTVSFKILVTALFPETTTDENGNEVTTKVESTKVLTVMEDQVLGYWVTDLEGNNGYYATEKGSETDLIYTECYLLSVNDLLAQLDYGYAEIIVARIGKTGEIYYQYNETTFEVYKLNKVNDTIGTDGSIKITDNYLNFTWTQIDSAQEKDIAPTAYYVIFENSEGQQIKRITTFVCSVDLRNVGLTSGTSYVIKVIALSAEKTIIASDLCQSVATLRFTTPISLQVKDGILTFDENEFLNTPFMQDIVDYFAQDTEEIMYHGVVGRKQYTSPYYFTPASLDELYVTLRFTKLDAVGGITNTVYTSTMFGYWLFPDITIDFNLLDYATIQSGISSDSYFNLLEKYNALKLSGLTSNEAKNTRAMIETLSLSPRGLCDNAVLFDDFGRAIPTGEYLVSVIQTKSNQFVESANSPAVKMYVSSAPEISLQTEVIDNLTQYTADFTPASTMNYNVETGKYEAGGARRYKLSLRPTDGKGTYYLTGNLELIITYNDSTSLWEIAYNGTIIENVISNNNNSNFGLPGFKINMSALRLVINRLTGEPTIPTNTLMRADVIAYAQDDGYVLNGKSGVFNVRYLDLTADSINFTGGKFVVNAPLNSNNELLVKYKLVSQGQSSFTTKFMDGEAVIEFDKTGIYEYVVLSLYGSISSNTMNIESASYAIADLYKLSAPTLTTSNSNLIINYNPLDVTYMNSLEFNMANDISLHDAYNSADKGYYYQSIITKNSSLAPYVVGSKDANGDTIYPSELMASKFYAFLNGNSGTFTLSDKGHAMADFLLEFSEEWAIMTSAETSLNARMLAYVDGYSISQGNLIIDDRHVGRNIVSDEDRNDLSGNIVFEVVIGYYVEDNDNPGYALKVGEETYYSERQYYSDYTSVAQEFSGLLFNTNYDYFEVSVTVVGARRVDSITTNAIRTVEGTYVLLNNSVYFYDDGAHVLRSQTQTAPFLLARTEVPYLASGSKGVRNGNINFVIDKSIYFAETIDGVDVDTAKRISLIARYTESGATTYKQITGTFAFATSAVVGEENYVYVTFTPDEGQLNDIVGAFDVLIYAYGYQTVISEALIIEDIYKLPNVSSKYYSIGLQEANTLIDLSSYFTNVAITNDNTCYKLVITYVDAEGATNNVTLKSSSSIQKFVIPEGATIVSIQAQDGQDETEANAKKLLYSDTTKFDIYKTDIQGLNLSWNSTQMRFEWEWEDDRTDAYEYFVSVTVNNKTTTETITTNYYLPKDRGLIATGGFEIKARKLGETNSTSLYTFSDTLAYQGEEVEYNLFSGGNGSKSNPYLIRSETDFINMSKRNRSDFYFKLDTNILAIDLADLFISVEGQIIMLMQDFNGHFDGNGYTLQVTSSQVFDLSESYTPNLIGSSGLSFNQYSSLFRNISIGASISNLFVKYVIDYEDLNESNILFSSLCAYNYGTIDNVRITDVNIASLNGQGVSNTALVGGIASVNYGVIKSCNNTDEFDYTMAQQLNLTFGYAGIATFNGNNTTFVGSIENSFNLASKKVSVSVNNTLVYMAGITLANGGNISKAGNDGALYLTAKTNVSAMTGYYAGIVVANNNGTLEYVYNNAVIENTTNNGTFNFAGVAYTISGGKINTLVVTVSSQPIVKVCSNKPSDIGSNYASSDSGTSSNIATKELSLQTISCGGGYTLAITQTASGWKATIV